MTLVLAAYVADLVLVCHAVVFLLLAARVLMRRRPAGVALAWLLVIALLPLIGPLWYLLVGERHLGWRRAARSEALLKTFESWLSQLPDSCNVAPETFGRSGLAVNRLAQGTIGLPALKGNRLAIYAEALEILANIVADIDRAVSTCHLEFYIWNPGGLADEVAEALLRAAGRGVRCRVLLDGVGSREFFASPWTDRLRNGGVDLVEALPASLLRAAVQRVDLRLHRKIVVIDGEVAYTGSLNLVDPRFFKKEAGVGQWVDAMVRLEGPAVQVLNAIFIWDWEVETDERLGELIILSDVKPLTPLGPACVQVVPSGPGFTQGVIHELLVTASYAAQDELVITTPYFVPDDALLNALASAARRGVRVKVIVPREVDSWLVRHASRACFEELLLAGVKINHFTGGLLHTKSVLIDGELAFFGTVNLDMRSFWLNFEVSLLVYDENFGTRVRLLQKTYEQQSEALSLRQLRSRPLGAQLLDRIALLWGPLL